MSANYSSVEMLINQKLITWFDCIFPDPNFKREGRQKQNHDQCMCQGEFQHDDHTFVILYERNNTFTSERQIGLCNLMEQNCMIVQ